MAMNRERAIVDDRTEEERAIDARIAVMPPCPGIPSTDEDVAAAIERARADVAAGRVHSHDVVKEWLTTWGDADYEPFHDWLARRNG